MSGKRKRDPRDLGEENDDFEKGGSERHFGSLEVSFDEDSDLSDDKKSDDTTVDDAECRRWQNIFEDEEKKPPPDLSYSHGTQHKNEQGWKRWWRQVP